jgi:hypothetical protein
MLDLQMLLVKTLTLDGTNSSSMRKEPAILSTRKDKSLVYMVNKTIKIDKLFLRTKETM